MPSMMVAFGEGVEDEQIWAWRSTTANNNAWTHIKLLVLFYLPGNVSAPFWESCLEILEKS